MRVFRQTPALTIVGTVLKESGDLVILGVTFDSNIRVLKAKEVSLGDGWPVSGRSTDSLNCLPSK